MNALPPHTENKAENGQMEPSSRTALLSETTADRVGIDDSKHPPHRTRRGTPRLPSNSQRGKEYGVAFGATLLAFFLRLSLDSYLDDRLPYAAFLVATAVTTWYSGIGPSLVAMVLGGLIANWAFIPPRYALSVTDLTDQAGIAVYATVCFAMVGFAQTWRWAWRKTEGMTSELQMEMDRHRRTEEESAHAGSTEGKAVSQHERRL